MLDDLTDSPTSSFRGLMHLSGLITTVSWIRPLEEQIREDERKKAHRARAQAQYEKIKEGVRERLRRHRAKKKNERVRSRQD